MAKKYSDDKPIAWTAELGLAVKNISCTFCGIFSFCNTYLNELRDLE